MLHHLHENHDLWEQITRRGYGGPVAVPCGPENSRDAMSHALLICKRPHEPTGAAIGEQMLGERDSAGEVRASKSMAFATSISFGNIGSKMVM